MTEPQWYKSSYSGDGSNCVEVAPLAGGQMGVRDSKNPGQPHLTVPMSAWADFVSGVATGEFRA